MRQRIGWTLALMTLAIVRTATANAEEYLSPVALAVSPNGSLLYVAESGSQRLAVVDVATRAVVREIALSVAAAST